MRKDGGASAREARDGAAARPERPAGGRVRPDRPAQPAPGESAMGAALREALRKS
jgi:hypothetical protein